MTGKRGVFLSPEQSVRLALCDSMERERLIAGIAAHLRKAAQPGNTKVWQGGTPREWYRAAVRTP